MYDYSTILGADNGSIGWAHDRLAANRHLTPSELALVVEHCAGKPLPHWLTAYVCLHLRGAVKQTPGAKPGETASPEWLDAAGYLYETQLAEEQTKTPPRRHVVDGGHRSDDPPADRAAHDVIRILRRAGRLDVPMQPRRLRNLLSAARPWKRATSLLTKLKAWRPGAELPDLRSPRSRHRRR